MWQNNLNGILGLWIIILAFLGFSDSLFKIMLVGTGVFIVIISFFGRLIFRPTEDLASLDEKPKKELSEEPIEESVDEESLNKQMPNI
jgi:hypothetical protein